MKDQIFPFLCACCKTSVFGLVVFRGFFHCKVHSHLKKKFNQCPSSYEAAAGAEFTQFIREVGDTMWV